MARLAGSSWQHVDQFQSVLRAAQRELPGQDVRARHDRILARLRALIDRGQRSGAFRSDLPARWLVGLCYSVMHAAAQECAAGRLDPGDAAWVITATLLAAFTEPGEPVPAADANPGS